MAGERCILAVLMLFFCSLASIAATFKCCEFLLSFLMMKSFRQRQLPVNVQAMQQYNAAVHRTNSTHSKKN